MLPYLIILFDVAISSVQGICQKKYTLRAKHYNPNLFSAFVSLFAMVYFILTSGFKMNFTPAFLPYSVLFGVAYGVTTVCSIYAITYGPMAVSSLIISYSMLVPTVFGIAVLNEKLHKAAYIGILLLCISMYLINTKNEKQPITWKWVLFVVLAFIGNGGCMTTQKMEQYVFNGGYKNEFMIVALLISATMLFAVSRINGGNLAEEIRECSHYPITSGVANGINNMLVMILTNMMPAAILFPSVTAVSMTLTYLIARFMFGERLTKKQTTGYIVGMASIILLNL